MANGPPPRPHLTSASSCGFLVINKPAGCTSHDCVAIARRLLGIRRVGHGGTLDPAVTGVLPLAIGPATRLLPYLDGTKAYLGRIQLGLNTDSDDLSGEVLNQTPWPLLKKEQLEDLLSLFCGEQMQRPPNVSAVHIDGERAYKRARRGEQLQIPPRPVTIHHLKLLEWNAAEGNLAIELRCSAGTYVRSIARDLGERLGCGAALAELQRTSALGFEINQAIPLEALQPSTPLLDPLLALGARPQLKLDSAQWQAWCRGQRLPASSAVDYQNCDVVAMLRPDGSLAGLAHPTSTGELQPRVVFDAAG
ncbi:tRNA pseudouridine(55) synthase TruB [Synechococcus sp.]